MQLIFGLGTDIVSIDRFRTLRFPERAASFFLCKEELVGVHASSDPATYLASRFAVKEAVIKSAPVKLSPLDFLVAKSGIKPTILTHESLPYSFLISISHEDHYATAVAICVNKMYE